MVRSHQMRLERENSLWLLNQQRWEVRGRSAMEMKPAATGSLGMLRLANFIYRGCKAKHINRHLCSS